LKETFGVIISKRDAERALRTLRNLKLTSNRSKLARTSTTVVVPLDHEPSTEEIRKIKEQCATARITKAPFEEIRKRPRNLVESLRGKIPDKFLPSPPHSFDIIGEIATIDIPQELIQFSSTIGEGVMEIDPHLRLVLRKSSEIAGTFRTRRLEAIAGTGNTETTHREFSCLFQLDVAKAYFNPRLSHERLRVARQVKENECVLDMFAGVGPYSILIAKTQEDSKVYSIDINPDAFRYLKHNIMLNGVADRVIPLFGDARQLVEKGLRGTANRVIMNLPSDSRHFLEVALQALKGEGGVIHYYAFASRRDSVPEITKEVRSMIERQGRAARSFPFSDIIKEVAPNRVQVAIDVLVE
jgi:tRNA (guanine37-N1)-methyltransferase